jgi:hypothetical protein
VFDVSFHGREFACLFADALIEKIFETSTESILDKFSKGSGKCEDLIAGEENTGNLRSARA